MVSGYDHVNNDWYNTGIFCHWSCYVYSNV